MGDGAAIDLWHDCWLDDSPIASLFPQFIFPPNDIFSLLIASGRWLILNHLPPMLKLYLQSATNITIPTPLSVYSISWVGNASGILSLQDAWNLVRSRAATVPWSSLVWNNLVNPLISCFVWWPLHKRTPMQNWARSNGVCHAPISEIRD